MKEQRYVRPTVAGWLTPTLIAPWVSVWGAITAFVTLGLDKGLFGKSVAWLVGVTAGSIWAFVYCAILIAVDLALLTVRVRTLPAGKRGWGTAFLSPLAVFGVYTAIPPYEYYKMGPWAVGAALLVPMLAVAIGSRVMFGQKPPR